MSSPQQLAAGVAAGEEEARGSRGGGSGGGRGGLEGEEEEERVDNVVQLMRDGAGEEGAWIAIFVCR
jgi:hypothetical protein